MAFGAVMLASGALVNALLRLHAVTIHAASINGVIVAFSSIVIAAALARLLRTRGVLGGSHAHALDACVQWQRRIVFLRAVFGLPRMVKLPHRFSR